VSPHALLFDVMTPGLVERLHARGVRCILNGTALRHVLQSQRVPLECWEAFDPPDLSERVLQELTRITDGFARVLQTREAVRAFDSPLGNVLPVAGTRLLEDLLGMLARQLTVVETFQNLIRTRDLRLVVLGCDNNHLERTVVAAARLAGVPSLQLAHGLNANLGVHIAGEMDTLYADAVAVFGARARRNLIATGNSRERIFVTGAPGWDALYAPQARISVREARRRLQLEPDRGVVLFLPTCWHPNTQFPFNARRFAETTRALFRALQRCAPETQLLIRPHPGERAETRLSVEQFHGWTRGYEQWIHAEYGIEARIATEHKVEVIRAADVAITPGSTSVIPEIMILERPVIRVRGWDWDDLYGEEDGVVVVDRDGIEPALAALLRDPAARAARVERQAAALPELNHGHDGRALERVADLCWSQICRDSASTAVRHLLGEAP
jgi:hypothetical protein